MHRLLFGMKIALGVTINTGRRAKNQASGNEFQGTDPYLIIAETTLDHKSHHRNVVSV